MYHRFDGLPGRVLLDANVVMNAAFVSRSMARRAVELLPRLGYAAIVDQVSCFEAVSRSRDIARTAAIKTDPKPFIEAWLRSHEILEVSGQFAANAPTVATHDNHIAIASLKYSAWILTGDIRLFAECLHTAHPARLPMDVLYEHAMREEGRPNLLNLLVRYCPPLSYDRGSLFARCVPGGWAGSGAVGDFVVLDVEEVGCLSYSTGEASWVFEMDAGPRTSIASGVAAGAPVCLLVN